MKSLSDFENGEDRYESTPATKGQNWPLFWSISLLINPAA